MKAVKENICVIECEQRSTSIGIRLTGTPGVGKSCFLPYVKQELLKDKRKVFVTVDRRSVYFHGNEVEEDADPRMLLKSSEEYIIHLFDPSSGSEVAPTKAITILFVSPGRTKYGGFSTENIINLFMPPWRERELAECCKVCYGMEKKQVEELYEKWGGSIRRVVRFQKVFQKAYDHQLESFLSSQCLLDTINQVEWSHLAYDDRSQSHQWILHRWPIVTGDEADYCDCTLDFPSHYIKMKIRDALARNQIDWKASSNNPTLLGKLYETEVLRDLFKPISDEGVHHLQHKARHKPTDELFDVPVVRKYILFSNQDKINPAKKGALYTPTESNKTGIDYVMPPWIFLITLKKNHNLKNLNQIYEQFPDVEENWRVCFVIPNCITEKFRFPQLEPKGADKFILPFDAIPLS